MVKKPTEKSAAEKKAEASAAKASTAREQANKTNNPAHTKAAQDAEATAEADAKAVKREKFVKLTRIRASKTIDAMRTIVKLFNRRSYEYDAADGEKLLLAIQKEVNDLGAVIESSLKTQTIGAPKGKSGPSFSLD